MNENICADFGVTRIKFLNDYKVCWFELKPIQDGYFNRCALITIDYAGIKTDTNFMVTPEMWNDRHALIAIIKYKFDWLF